MQAEQVPAELVEAAARVIDPEAFEVPPRGYSPGAAAQSAEDARGKAAEILAAVYCEVQARVLEEAADDTNCLDDSDLLRDRAAALRTPDAGGGS